MGFWTWARHQLLVVECSRGRYRRGGTYADGGEDILELVDEGNEPRVIDVDAVEDMSVFLILVPRGMDME